MKLQLQRQSYSTLHEAKTSVDEPSPRKPIDPIHAYRSLLRAASYFPDTFTRTILQDQIKARFKTRARKKAEEKVTHRRLKKATQTARCLDRAGRGNKEDLYKILSLAYGRNGKRRRQLVVDLVRPAGSESPETKAAIEGLLENPHGPNALAILPTKKLRAFLKSQLMRPPPETSSARPKLRKLLPTIPAENIWGQAMPKSRKASIIKRWWADTLDKIYPPVPLHEWNHLKDISTGTIRVADIKPRRAILKSGDKIEQSHEAILRQLKDSRISGNLVFDPERGLVLEEEKAEDEDIIPSNYQRTMRRLYTVIWNVTPMMLEDEGTGEWQTSWGGTRSKFHEGFITQASGEAEELFQGLELLDGRKRVEKKSRNQKRTTKRQGMDELALDPLKHDFDGNEKSLEDEKKREDRRKLKAEKKLEDEKKQKDKQKDKKWINKAHKLKARIAEKRASRRP